MAYASAEVVYFLLKNFFLFLYFIIMIRFPAIFVAAVVGWWVFHFHKICLWVKCCDLLLYRMHNRNSQRLNSYLTIYRNYPTLWWNIVLEIHHRNIWTCVILVCSGQFRHCCVITESPHYVSGISQKAQIEYYLISEKLLIVRKVRINAISLRCLHLYQTFLTMTNI